MTSCSAEARKTAASSRRWALLACAMSLLAAGCSDIVLTPIRSAAASPPVDAGSEASSRDGGFGDRDDEDDDFDEGRLDAQHCASVLDWPQELVAAERALLEQINDLRDRRIECGNRDYEELPPLWLSPALQCSARLHSLDMVMREFEGRTNPDGEDPGERIRAAGFDADESSESIVIGEPDPARVLDELLEDWDDCMNVATRQYRAIGIGRYQDLWTLDFARD